MSVIDFKFDHDGLPNMPLKDLGNEPLVSATVGFNPTLPEISGIGFKINASTNGKIDVYNDAQDKDEDGVLGIEKEAEDEFGAVILPPQIKLNDLSALLKYRFEATAKASAAAKVVKNLDVKIEAGGKVVFADYHTHGRDEDTIAAVAADVPKLRFMGNPDDAFKLASNEALSYQLRGEFSGKVTLSWSDVFTFGLSQIAATLQNNELLMLKIDAAASIDFHVGIVDDFQLVLTKGTGSKVRVALKKGKSKTIGGSAGVNIGVEFADQQKAEDFFNEIYEAMLGQSLNKVKTLLGKPEDELNKLIDELPPAAKKMVEEIRSRLKIPGLQTLKEFKEQIERVEKTIKDTISAVAKEKVKLGFKYEYLRVSTDDTLLVVQLDRDKFNEFHSDLMLCDFINLLEWAKQPANKTAVERYLNQKTITTNEAWGFTLSIGKWKFFGKDEKDHKAIIQTDLEGRKRIAYRFLRKYDASFGEKFSWTVDLKAEMGGFAVNPTACDFEYGLHFARTFEDKLDKKDLRRVFDDAVIWQGIHLEGLDEAIEKIETEGLLGQKAKIATQLIIKDQTLRKLLSLAENSNNDSLMASALSMAMVYDDKYKTRSENLNDRERAYVALWEAYFRQPNLDGQSYADMAYKTIRKNPFLPDAVKLSEHEKGTGIGAGQKVYAMWLETFSGAIYFHAKSDNSTVNEYRKKFTDGLSLLNNAISKCQPHDKIKDAYVEMRPFFTQSLFVRAAGVYLIRLAARNGLLGEINRSCTVTYADKSFSFGKSA